MKNIQIVLILLTVFVAQPIWRCWVVNYRVIASDNIEITNVHIRNHKTFNVKPWQNKIDLINLKGEG